MFSTGISAKRMALLCGCLYFFTQTYSQIRFEQLPWKLALAKAHREHKMIFVEMYLPSCTYCRQMEQTVFTTDSAGSFYNRYFINLRYNALQSDGIQIRQNYRLFGFPTFLYLNPNGIPVIKTSGFQAEPVFLKNGDSAHAAWQKKQQVPFLK